MQKQQRFIPKTALIVSTILLAAGGIATTSTAYAGSFEGLPKSQAMSWFASPKQKEPGPGMNQGYLVFHNSKTTYKGKAKKAENILKAKPFGPVHFTKNKDGNTTNLVWTIPFDRETAGDLAGKIGCFYENAASFRPHGKMTAQHLDAAMVVVGWNQAQDKDFNRIKQYYLDKNHGTSESHNIYNYISKHSAPVKNQVWFDTNSIGLSAQGKGSISVAIQFYDHKTHKRVYPKSAYTLKDMDERQHFSVGNLIKGGSAGDRVYYGYDDSKKKKRYKSHTLVKYDNAYGSGPTNTTFEGDPKVQGDDYVPKGISGDTVYTHDPRGWIKFFDKWSQNGHPLVITFHHNMNGYHTTYGMYEKHPYVQKGLDYLKYTFGTSTNISKYGHLKNPASLKSTGKVDKNAGLDYFSLGGTADEPDQPITFTGKMVGTSEKGKYYSHLALAGSKNKKFYFDVYGDVEWPGMRTGGVTGSTDNMNYQGLPAFQLQDKVDEQLTVGKPQVYQTASNTKYYSNDSKNGDQAGKLMLDSNKQSYGYLGHAKNVTSWFDIPDPKKLSDGKHLVMASAKKSVLKASNTAFYNHVYHLIIPVTADHVKYNLTDFKMANNLIKKGTTLDVSKDKVGSTHVDDSVKEYVTTQTSGTVAHGSSITTFKTVKSGKSESGTNWYERKFSAVKHATIQNIGGLNEPVNGAIENSKNWKHTQPASVTILQVPEKWDSDTKAVKHAYVKPYGSNEFDYDHPWDGKLIWDDSSDDYDGAGSLAPGQDVAYRAKFHFDKLITLKETRKEFHKK